MTSARSLLSKEDGMFRHRVLFKVLGKLQLIGKKTATVGLDCNKQGKEGIGGFRYTL